MCVCENTHSCAVIAHSAASSQAGVKVGDAVGAAYWSVLVDPAATVHIATARQVPVGQRQGRPTATNTEEAGGDKERVEEELR